MVGRWLKTEWYVSVVFFDQLRSSASFFSTVTPKLHADSDNRQCRCISEDASKGGSSIGIQTLHSSQPVNTNLLVPTVQLQIFSSVERLDSHCLRPNTVHFLTMFCYSGFSKLNSIRNSAERCRLKVLPTSSMAYLSSRFPLSITCPLLQNY